MGAAVGAGLGYLFYEDPIAKNFKLP